MPTRKNNSSVSVSLTDLLLFIIPFFSLLIVLFLKYRNQNLSLTEFKFFYIGNLLNIFVVLGLLLLTLILMLKRKSEYLKSRKKFLIFAIISLILLLVGWLFNELNLSTPKVHFYYQPFSKIIVGVLFLAFQFIQIFWLSMVWIIIFNIKNFVYLRSLVNSLLILSLIFFFAFIHTDAINSNRDSNIELNKKGDIAVVLGAAVWKNNKPSTTLSGRLNAVSELYKKGLINKIQLTGGNAPGELTEAEVAFLYLKKLNIPNDVILLEKKTSSTTEQISYIKNELINRKDYKKIIIVSDKYHFKRIMEICKFYNIEVELVASRVIFSFKDLMFYKLREGIALCIFWFFAL
jgi:vancomycin permeability regulator SanA